MSDPTPVSFSDHGRGRTNGSYREFPEKLRDAAFAPNVRTERWGGHWISNHLKDAANEIDRLRSIVRVNALRHGASHEEVDALLFQGASS